MSKEIAMNINLAPATHAWLRKRGKANGRCTKREAQAIIEAKRQAEREQKQ